MLYIGTVKLPTMTRLEFNQKYGERPSSDTEDVLMRIASNISDLQHDESIADCKLDMLKQYIFDYQSVLRNEKVAV